jgi:hypothetical protein
MTDCLIYPLNSSYLNILEIDCNNNYVLKDFIIIVFVAKQKKADFRNTEDKKSLAVIAH